MSALAAAAVPLAGQGYEPPNQRNLGVSSVVQTQQMKQKYLLAAGFQKEWTRKPSAACTVKKQRPGASPSVCAAAATGGVAALEAYWQIMLATSPSTYSAVNTNQTGGTRLIQAEPGNQEVCNTCTAFAVVAAAQAAVASALQRDVQQLLMSVQDFFYCGPTQRTCFATWNLAAAVQELQQRQLLSSSCLPYTVTRPDSDTECVARCKETVSHVANGRFSYEMVTDEWDAQRHIRERGETQVIVPL
jgi:hypothetical protein